MNDWWRSFYDEAFTDLLCIWKDERELADTARFLTEQLDIRPGTRVFDQCCGVGSLSLPLARAGAHIIGVDLSPDFINKARAQAHKLELNCEFHCADAFEFVPSQPCQAAFNWHTSFGYSDDDTKNRRMLERAFLALEPGGRFVLDYPNMAGLLRDFQPSMLRRFATAAGEIVLLRESTINLTKGMLEQRWTTINPEGARQVRASAVRIYLPHALAGLLAACGFSNIHFHGGTDGSPLELTSPRCICIATRSV